MTDGHTHHGLDYVEIGVADLDRARRFYTAAFGWSFRDYGGQYAGILAPDGEGEVGGLNPSGPRGGDGPLVLLWSDDLEATATAVTEAGGTVVQGPYDFPGGRRLHFRDTEGNELGVWTGA